MTSMEEIKVVAKVEIGKETVRGSRMRTREAKVKMERRRNHEEDGRRNKRKE